MKTTTKTTMTIEKTVHEQIAILAPIWNITQSEVIGKLISDHPAAIKLLREIRKNA